MTGQALQVMRAEAVNLGRRMAASCLNYDRTGRAVRVVQMRAVKVLERAFYLPLSRSGKPVVFELTMFEAMAFPHRESTPTDPAATPWLAVWSDGQGHGTYSLRWLCLAACGKAERQTLAELAMMAELSVGMERQGIQMGRA
jgi:hypothetical protein